MMKLKHRKIFRLLFILHVIIIAIFIFVYHEKVITYFDSVNLLINTEICKQIPDHINKMMLLNNDNFNLTKNNNSLNRVAIIVPYRNRAKNLKLFLTYMHQFLSKQNKLFSYGIYLVEPIRNLVFNRALLINIGFMEVIKQKNLFNDCNCFIFHDIDMLPENEQNVYACNNEMPKQMATSISVFNYSTDGYFKNKYFGGVNAFTKEQFLNINGLSNMYFDWGLEDDDARMRVLNKYKTIERLSPKIGRYFANCHKQQKRNPNRLVEIIII
jgi:hypothetical protein